MQLLNKPDFATRLDSDKARDAAASLSRGTPLVDSLGPEFGAVPGADERGAYEVSESELAAADISSMAPSTTILNHKPAAPGDGHIATTDDDIDEAEADEIDIADDASSDIERVGVTRTELRGWPRFEAWVERLAHKYKFIRKITSRLYLPIAFHSGLTMKKLDPHRFTYVLPFRRFNRNFYDAMAGAALIANSEIAAGMFLFGELGGQWTVVCKHITYRFLRPCLGPAIYKVNPLDDVKALLRTGVEFNIDLTLEILQQVSGKKRHPRVGRCEVTFHCAPKGPEGNRGLSHRRRRRKSK